MSKKINIPDILAKHMTQKGDPIEENRAAIKEIIEEVLKLAAENGTHYTSRDISEDVEKAILDTSKQVEYE